MSSAALEHPPAGRAAARPRAVPAQALLGELPVLRGLAPEQLARLVAASPPVKLDRGEWLFRWGERCTGFYAVARGSVKVAYFSPQGAEKVVEIVRPGQSFGEPLVFLGQPCLVSARALADSTLLHIPGRVLESELGRDPRLARSLLAGLARRLQALLHDAGSNALRSGAERLVDYLLSGLPARAETSPTAEIALPRKGALASRLDMTPEHFSRILHKLAGLSLIEVSGRQVRVPDLQRLRAWRG